MKHLITMRRTIELSDLAIPVAIISLLVLSLTCSAQWSSDPTAPMALCNAANNQTGLKVISDSDSGYYAFWSDARANASLNQLYGQHLDASGNALWTANGMLIIDQPDSSINENVPLLLPDGDLMIIYSYNSSVYVGEVIMAMRFSPEGLPVWAAPVQISRGGPGPLGTIHNFQQIKCLVSGDNVWLAWAYDPQGGNGYYAVERMDFDGNTQLGSPGLGTGLGFGPFTIHDDLAGGLILDWRTSNGSGAPLKAMRIDSAGAPVWTGQLNVSAGTAGLNFAFATAADSTGSYISIMETNNDLAMARYDTAATFLWAPQPFYACNESHTQSTPDLLLMDDHFYVAWRDSRPPASNADMYLQKFDMDGTPLWTADGVEVIAMNTYIPTPLVVAGDEGAVIATFDGGDGFVAQRASSDGSLDWPAPVPFVMNGNGPFYELRTVLADGMGGVTAFWQTYEKDLYAAHIDKYGNPGDHVGVNEVDRVQSLKIFPNPATDRISLNTEVAMRSVRVLGMDGRTLIAPTTFGKAQAQLDVSSLAPGSYFIEATTAEGRMIGRFVKQ